MSGCGLAEIDPEQAACRDRSEVHAACDGDVTVVIGEDLVGNREKVERGFGEDL